MVDQQTSLNSVRLFAKRPRAAPLGAPSAVLICFYVLLD